MNKTNGQDSQPQSEQIKKIKEQILSSKNIITQARLMQYLREQQNCRIADLSKMLEMDAAYICNLIRVLKLPTLIIDGYYNKNVSISHLIVISRVKDQQNQIKLYEKILSDNLSVRQTEDLVRQILYGVDTTGKRIEKKFLNRLEKKLSLIDEDLDIKITQTQIKAKVTIIKKGSLQTTSKFLQKLHKIISSGS